jgi:hypothetical protein
LLKEWAAHRLAEDNRSPADLLAALDKIVVAQLHRLLSEATLPSLVSGDQAVPYERQPALGHWAIYSLNLIVLRASLSDTPYLLDESELDDQPNGCRAWDRVAAIWRSWFPPESLAALAFHLTTTRVGTQLAITAARSPLTVVATTPLEAAYDASLALADSLTTGSLGLHLASLASTPKGYLEALRDGVEIGAADLLPIAEFALSRIAPSVPSELPIFSEKYISRYGRAFPPVLAVRRGHHPEGLALDFAEMANMLTNALPSRRTPVEYELKLGGLIGLSRYAAEVAVRYRERLGPVWLSNLLDPRWSLRWDEILAGPAAAPILRFVLRELNDAQCALIAEAISSKMSDSLTCIFDIDTAAAVAVLAWRSRLSGLCARSLELILQARTDETWRLLDIPAQTWDGLADLFVSSGEQFIVIRQQFAELLERELVRFSRGGLKMWGIGSRAVTPVEIGIHALRIGISDRSRAANTVLAEIFSEKYLHGSAGRRWFLLLIRWMREKGDDQLVRQFFNMSRLPRRSLIIRRAQRDWREILGVSPDQTLEALDIEKVCGDLSYREAMDLRWAIEAAREPDT